MFVLLVVACKLARLVVSCFLMVGLVFCELHFSAGGVSIPRPKWIVDFIFG